LLKGIAGPLAATLFLAGCGSGPQMSSDEFVSLVLRKPDYHLGQFVAGYGATSSVRKGDDFGTAFRLSDKKFNFAVNYPNLLSDLGEGEGVWFLGRVSGEADWTNRDGENVRAIRVQAIEVDTVYTRHFIKSESEFIAAWQANRLPLR